MTARPSGTESPRGEVHARKHRGEIVLNPDHVSHFLADENLAPPHPEYGGRPVDVEIRTATAEQNPPNGAIWLTALGLDVSIKADPRELLRVMHEAGLLEQLRRSGDTPGL